MLEPTPGDPRSLAAAKDAGHGSISFEDFTQATLGAVAKVINDNRGNDHPLFRNPWITMGIIWRPDWPENPQFPGKGPAAGG